LQSTESSIAESLFDPVLRHFTESLETVSTAHPDLAAQCESLTGRLQKLLQPQSPDQPWEDGNYDDVPF
ncbi:MAG TPA: hypothetical protein VGH74_21455, partial [Planctomycetaceae bacterium]